MYERIITGADGIDYKITSSSNIAELVISVGYGIVEIASNAYSCEDNLHISTVELKTLEEAPMVDVRLMGFDYKKENKKYNKRKRR